MGSTAWSNNGNERAKITKWLRRQGLPCALCGHEIDYGLPSGDPMSFSVDHIVPLSKGGAPFDRENVQPAHLICNMGKSDKVDIDPSAVELEICRTRRF